MLKEKMYAEYQQRYKNYEAMREDVKRLEMSIDITRSEENQTRKYIETRKKNALQRELNNKKELERKLSSVRNEGTASAIVKEYSDTKLSEIHALESSIRLLESAKTADAKELKKKKRAALDDLEKQKQKCQNELNDIGGKIGLGNGAVKQFDEKQLRQQLEAKKNREVSDLTDMYDSSIGDTERALENLDIDYDNLKKNELACIYSDASLYNTYQRLAHKAEEKQLPEIISNALEEPVGEVIARERITCAKDVARLSANATSLDDLNLYQPGWLGPFAEFGIPLLLGAVVFLIFMATGVEFSFVTTATNAVANLLMRGLCIVAGFGIVFAILAIFLGPVLGVVGGLIGGVIGYMVSDRIDVILPYNVTNVVEWIVKILICLAVALVAFFLINRESMVKLFMKIGFLKNAALAKQGAAVEEFLSSYYILLKHNEIVEQIVSQKKENQREKLTAELAGLRQEKDSAIQELACRLDREAEDTVKRSQASAEASRKAYEQNQKQMIQTQDNLFIKLSEFDGKVQNEAKKYDDQLKRSDDGYNKKIADAKERLRNLKAGVASDKDMLIQQLQKDISAAEERYRKNEEKFDREYAESCDHFRHRILEIEDRIAEIQRQFAPEFNAMNRLLLETIRGESPRLEETCVVSDTLYIFSSKELSELQGQLQKSNGETGGLMPVKLHEIRHEKNPIVFLYESTDSAKIATNLYPFMDAVNIGFFIINCRKIFNLYITDPVSQGINFKDQEKGGRLKIVGDIKKLYEIISGAMDFVASKGQKLSIDELNARLLQEGNDEEDINKFGKYNIVQFIVPEEESAQTTDFFSNDIWTKFETSKKHGFLPIFYINKNEWKNALNDEEKFNSKFINKLNKVLGSNPENIYEIDWENISIKKYRG